MTKTLTTSYANFYAKPKGNTFKIVAICVAVFLLVSIVIVAVVSSNNKAKIYSSKQFYLVYSGKYTQTSVANQQCTLVSDKGGAGYLYLVGNTKFVVVNAYFSDSDAKKVASQIKPTFSDSNVIVVKSAKISKDKCKKIESSASSKKYYKKIYEFCEKLYELSLACDKGEINASGVYKQIMLTKQTFTQLCEEFNKKTDAISSVMQNSCMLMLEQINSFFSSSFVTNNVGKYIKKLYVGTILEFVDMCENVKTC